VDTSLLILFFCLHIQVLCFEGRRWADDVDYMFFRNCVPNRDKLLSKLVSESVDVANNCAYCCQCSWINAQVLEIVTARCSAELFHSVNCLLPGRTHSRDRDQRAAVGMRRPS
jgi:hypothetical protein